MGQIQICTNQTWINHLAELTCSYYPPPTPRAPLLNQSSSGPTANIATVVNVNPQHYIAQKYRQKYQPTNRCWHRRQRGNIWSGAAITRFYKRPECSLNFKVPEALTTHLIWPQPAYESERHTQRNCLRYHGRRSCSVIPTAFML